MAARSVGVSRMRLHAQPSCMHGSVLMRGPQRRVRAHAKAVDVEPSPQIVKMASRVMELEDWIVDVRRKLHANPELSFLEFNTSAFIRAELDTLGIPYTFPVANTGIVAYIGSGAAAAAAAGPEGWAAATAEPVVLLRADMDALPITESTSLPFASCNRGVMHACGHDCHMASLLGAARLLKEAELDGSLGPGTIRLVFQPGEEAGGGGKLMGQEGVFKGVDAAFALHVWPDLPAGTIATRPGPIMAAVLSFEATVSGVGGHAAMPHTTVNPVIAAATIISQLKSTVTATVAPDEPVIVNVCHLRGGDAPMPAFNVVPDVVQFGGTIRAFSNDIMSMLRQRLEEVVATQALVFGCIGSIDFREEVEPYFPPLINDEKTTEFAVGVASRIFGPERVLKADMTMASEDFAFTAEEVPSCFAFLGIRNEELGSTQSLHTPGFLVDESVLKLGATYMAALASEFLMKDIEQQELE